MNNIANYRITETLYKSEKTSVFLATDDAQEKFVLKTTTNPYPTPEELKRFEREYEISQNVQNEGVAKVLSLLPQGNSLVILQEYIEAPTLKNLLQNRSLSVQEVLQIAIHLANTLEQIHHKNVIHKDINCNNILVKADTLTPYIIDFDIATQLSIEKTEIETVNNLQGTLAYISPEQTGRMNRNIDYRTDLYSLGIVLYEMLTGELPFKATEQMELIHSHIAVVPQALHLLNPEVPELVSKIVLKLLKKNAENRYQSARGVHHDLALCLQHLQEGKTVNADTFTLGQNDYSDKFQIPQSLYGRENERSQLLNAFDQTCEEGKAQLVLVKGYSGIGKSVLIQEIQKPITQRRGYYIRGKFEQFQRNIPYLAIIQAFDALMDHILTEPQEKLQQWKTYLLAALEGNGSVIIEVIPKLELVIGAQPAVEELPSLEAQNRFNYTFEQFIKVFTQKAHPIMLVIDDLQWADNASLQLLELFLKNAQGQYLFIVGSYRDNEVDDAHPLTLSLNEISKQTEIQSIALKNLEQAHVNAIVTDTLKTDSEEVATLAQLIFAKTEGNPFFVNQFLNSLYEEKLLTFDHNQSQWQWDNDSIQGKNMTDNVIELLVNKIEKLPAETVDLLKLAAAFNNQFDTGILKALVQDKFIVEIEKALDVALREQLILETGHGYKFQHDRIQQAAYSLISEESAPQVHLSIGENLLQNASVESLELEIFNVANQFNKAKSLITDEDAIDQLISLNFQAAQKAKHATAYDSALNYLHQVLEYIQADAWDTQYELTYQLYKELIEVEYLNGNYEQAEKYAQITLDKAQTALEKAVIYNTLIIQNTLLAKYPEAIGFGKSALELLSFNIPKDEELEAGIGAGFGAVAQHLAGRPILSIVDAPDVADATDVLIIEILGNMAPPAYFINPNLWTFIIVQATALGLEKGNTPDLCTIYSSYGILCGVVFTDFVSGYQYGELSYKLSEKYNNLKRKCNACFVMGTFLTTPVKPAKETIPILKEGLQVGLQSGELQFAAYSAMNIPVASFVQGNPLSTILAHSEESLHIALKYQNFFAMDIILPSYVLANALSDTQAIPPGNLPHTSEAILERTTQNQTFSSTFNTHTYQAIAQLIFGDIQAATQSLGECLKLIAYNVGNVQYVIFQYYFPLIHLQLIKAQPETKDEILPQIQDFIDKLKQLCELNPDNFLNKYKLIEAELAHIEGDYLQAMDLYEEAIEAGKAQGFLLENAIASQLAAAFYEKINKATIARVYWQQAHQFYNIWGATKKVSELEKAYPYLLKGGFDYQAGVTVKTTVHSTVSGKSGSIGEKLDFDTILKASQTLSEEVVLGALLEKMMKTLIENSGAQRGFLLLYRNQQLYLEAEVDVSTEKITTLQTIPLKEINQAQLVLSDEIVNFVARTQQTLVLNNASQEGQFTHTTYITSQHTKSLLCLPLLKSGNTVGILYLENNLTTGAFTNERLEVLNVLSSQMAISVENALLYENLEDKVAERTQQLNDAYHEIKQKNDDITASISYGQRIQQAILPNTQRIEDTLGNSFVLFKPRDIVSGDFYWFTEVNDKIVIAAVDCTGHGVPGAFMSMIGNSLLSEIVSVKNILSPSDILDTLDKGIQTLLKQDRTKNRDGMDLALCVWDKTKKVLTFAGARNPLVYIQNEELHVIKGNKYSIGGEIRKREVSFEEHHIAIDKPTVCYIFSDGYQDQFGGAEDKKFMKKRFHQLLLETHSKEMVAQRAFLNTTLVEWQHKNRQTDDILIVGFKVE
ncbi:hypothetical protein BKI52_41275 [marine bacterium AO1-C]|nr:hypothetical protein BKI52_41275 [marine bacterium AO1-C]